MMATYFNGSSEIQADHLQMLYLMNSSCAATSYSHAAQQHLVGIPLPHFGSGTLGPDLIRPSSFHEIQGSTAAAGPRFSLSELGSPMGIRGASKQGLFLSLNNSSMAGAVLSPGAGGGSPQSVILGSNYLKATQELLDEVVSMADTRARGAHKEKAKAKMEIASDDEDAYGSSNGSVKKGGVSGELSSAQRQELQMKKAKLLNMLDEVEQRYKQYQIQMHRVGSALEQAAGAGSAKSYTSLAFHTISKQFRCLKDAIASQVKETGRRMGEEADDKEGGKTSTRLRMVEQQLRQQRAMQQIGMMHSQHPAWRRQRGLPRRAVSVLRAWLFEHFLHPYPKDSDKHTLAKQAGLTRSQVSNWFINARVRLWKPMVEEMYVEEMKVTVHCQKDSDGANTTTTNNNNNYPSKAYSSLTQKSTPLLQSYNRISEPNLSPPPPNNSIINDIPNPTLVSQSLNRTKPTLHTIGPEFSLIRSSSSGMESILIQRSPKHQRSSVRDIHSPSNKDLVTTPNVRFGSSNYPVDNHIGSRLNLDHHHNQQLGQSRYNHASNAVSLTLGLPHCENLLSLSRAHQQQKIFFSGQAMQLDRMLDMGEPEWCGSQPDAHSGVDGSGYEGSIDMQTGKRFEAQPLPDFVA